MTQHDAFTQGFQDTARAHYGAQSDVLSELDAINQRAKEYERNKRYAVTPYEAGTLVEYAAPAPKPYESKDEALIDLKDAFGKTVVYLAPRVFGIAVVGGVGMWIVSFFEGMAARAVVVGTAVAAPAVGFSTMTIAGCIFALAAFLWFVLSGMAGGGEAKQGAKTEHHHHYYQYNNQGPGGQQNTKHG